MKKFISENKSLFPILGLVFIISFIFIIFKPEYESPLPIAETFPTFSLVLMAFLILSVIGVTLFHRWISSYDITTLLWGVGFLIYSITFLGLVLKSLGVSWANESVPEIFFMFRQSMIIWVCLIYTGLAIMLSKSKLVRYVPPIVAGLAAYIIFFYGLFVVGNIELTMYWFLGLIFIPMCVTIAYLFIKTGYIEKIFSLELIGIGFLVLALTYMAWAPWHKSYFYFVWFSWFIVGLVGIATGFKILPYEKYKMSLMKKGKRASSAKKAS